VYSQTQAVEDKIIFEDDSNSEAHMEANADDRTSVDYKVEHLRAFVDATCEAEAVLSEMGHSIALKAQDIVNEGISEFEHALKGDKR
jgi:hypothetical protein